MSEIFYTKLNLGHGATIEEMKAMGMCPECYGRGAILNSHKCSDYYKKHEPKEPEPYLKNNVEHTFEIVELKNCKEFQLRIYDKDGNKIHYRRGVSIDSLLTYLGKTYGEKSSN